MADAPNPVLDVLNQILGRQIAIEARLTAIDKRLAITHQLAILCAVQTGGILDMTIKVDDIVAKITPLTGVIDGAVTLLADLHQHLADAISANDPAKLQAVADAMDAGSAKLAAALAANTVASAETPPPAPTPDPAPPADPNAPTT